MYAATRHMFVYIFVLSSMMETHTFANYNRIIRYALLHVMEDSVVIQWWLCIHGHSLHFLLILLTFLIQYGPPFRAAIEFECANALLQSFYERCYVRLNSHCAEYAIVQLFGTQIDLSNYLMGYFWIEFHV